MGILFKRRRKSRLGTTNPLFRWLGPSVTSVGLLYVVYLVMSGGVMFSSLDESISANSATLFAGQSMSLGDLAKRPTDRIRIATFNIEHFADSEYRARLSEIGVDDVGTLANVVGSFDIVALQELQSPDGTELKRLIELLNQSGGTFAATMSDPIGEDSKVSYAFVWDQSRIGLIPGSDYVVSDKGGRMYREPMVATFQTRVPPNSVQRPFRFTMVNVQTKPDRVNPEMLENEINVLADVYQRVREYEFQQHSEDDVILLGDLNVTGESLGQLSTIDGVTSLSAATPQKSEQRRSSEHIVIDRNLTTEYANRMGAINLAGDLGLTDQQAGAIGNHLPVWAEFDVYERPPAIQSASPNRESRTRLFQ